MLYNIIKQLQDESSTNGKIEILKANKDNALLKEYMRLATCASVNFYITSKTLPDFNKIGDVPFEESALEHSVSQLYNRLKTGKDAKQWIEGVGNSLNEGAQDLFKMLLLKDVRAKVGATLVNKVWHNLCVSIPYQRCSLPDEKNLTKFKSGDEFIVQTKGDGQFASLVLDTTNWNEDVSLFTRNGNKFPSWFAKYISNGLNDNQAVYEGELLCYRGQEMLSRKEGNGILNSLMQGSDLPENVYVIYHVWNRLPIEDWKAGKTNLTYNECFDTLCKKYVSGKRLERSQVIDHYYVDSLEQAYKFNQEQLAKGLEGSIIKTLSHKWKDSTSKECLKLKIEAEIDLIWYDSVEGTGKASGMLGAMRLKSSDGKVVVDCGTGFTDLHRQELWENKDSLHGSVVTVKCNDLLSKEGSETLSLFLPVFVELRTLDKNSADDLERINRIFDAAKQGVV